MLKELLMNAVDATRQRNILSRELKSITIEFNSNEGTLRIIDEGIGMDKEDIVNYLLDLGKSFYSSDDYRSSFVASQRIQPLSEFGIGFASCFLIADHVVLETRKKGCAAILIDMFDLLGFAAAKSSAKSQYGTTATLYLKGSILSQVENTVKNLPTMCPHLEMPLVVYINGDKQEIKSQDYFIRAEDLLHPFFKTREKDFIVETRKFDPSTESLSGGFSITFNKKDGVMLPGSVDSYKLGRVCRLS